MTVKNNRYNLIAYQKVMKMAKSSCIILLSGGKNMNAALFHLLLLNNARRTPVPYVPPRGPGQDNLVLSEYKSRSLKETGLCAWFAQVAGRNKFSGTFTTECDNHRNPGSREQLLAKARRDGKWDVFRIVMPTTPVMEDFGTTERKQFFYCEASGISREDAFGMISHFDETKGGLKERKGFMGQKTSRRYPGIGWVRDRGLIPW
jgi:hypothetical protein